MDEVPDTRPSLLVRLLRPQGRPRLDRIHGDLLAADLPIRVPEGVSGRRRRRISSRRFSARSLPPWTTGIPTHVKGPFATGCSESRGT